MKKVKFKELYISIKNLIESSDDGELEFINSIDDFLKYLENNPQKILTITEKGDKSNNFLLWEKFYKK